MQFEPLSLLTREMLGAQLGEQTSCFGWVPDLLLKLHVFLIASRVPSLHALVDW